MDKRLFSFLAVSSLVILAFVLVWPGVVFAEETDTDPPAKTGDQLYDRVQYFYWEAGQVAPDDWDREEKMVILLDGLLEDLKLMDIRVCEAKTWATAYTSFWLVREFFLSGEYSDTQAAALGEQGSELMGGISPPACG